MPDQKYYQSQPEVLPETLPPGRHAGRGLGAREPVTTPSATESTIVDIEELSRELEAATLTLLEYSTEFDAAVSGLSAPVGAQAAAMTIAAHTLALLREVRASRAAGEPEPEWEPLHDGDGMLRVDEGNSYMFAIETNQGWEYFQDAIVWDSESDPHWYGGDAGWEIDDVTHFRALPVPPQSEPAATTEGT